MLRRVRARLTYANVVATLALFIAVGTGGAYAANTIGSSDIIDESLLSQDIKNGEVKNADLAADSITSTRLANGSIQNSDLGPDAVTTSKIKAGNVGTTDIADNAILTGKIGDGNVFTNDLADGAVTSGKVLDDTNPGGGLGAADLAPDSVGFEEIQTDGVQASEIADNSIDSGEIVDFGLSNEDVGVLFAQINADGSVLNSSGGVTSTNLGTGTYQVDFGRNISNCGFTATQGEGGIGGAGGAIMGVTDRSGNANAVFATARTNANALVNTSFQLVVVC
jgi:hypothetical protein